MNDQPIVFLDRDGTINVDSGYVSRPEDVVLIPGVSRAIGDLKRAGFLVVIVSNQSAVSRGFATTKEVDATNDELCRQLLAGDADARVDLIAYAVDHPDSPTPRRKPGIGMLEDVRAHWAFLPEECWMIGDKISDYQFGRNAGIPHAQCLFLRTGHGEDDLVGASPDLARNLSVFSDLAAAVAHLLSDTKDGER